MRHSGVRARVLYCVRAMTLPQGRPVYLMFYKSKGHSRRLIACLESEDTASDFARVWSKFWLSPIDVVRNSEDGAAVLISRYMGGTRIRHVFTPTFAR